MTGVHSDKKYMHPRATMLYDNPVKQGWRARGGLANWPHIAHMRLAQTGFGEAVLVAVARRFCAVDV